MILRCNSNFILKILIESSSRAFFCAGLLAVLVVFFMPACTPVKQEKSVPSSSIHFLDDLPAFGADSLLQVVVEIPAGTNEKWEVNKTTGQLEWQKISEDSMRVVDYLPYPANYGFIPQTYLPKEAGGDGDPVDIFVLGPSVPRGTILQVHLIGIIHMEDAGESDSKLVAVRDGEAVMKVRSLSEMLQHYPGALDILKIWLQHYKGYGQVEVREIGNHEDAWNYLYEAHEAYKNQSL